MGWNNTEPYLAAVSAGVRVGVVKMGKVGNARASITISKGVLKQLGDPETCDLFTGDGDDAGQVLIQCGDDGAHEIRELNKGGGKIVVNQLPGMPTEKRKPMGARHQISAGDGGEKLLTVWLPW